MSDSQEEIIRRYRLKALGPRRVYGVIATSVVTINNAANSRLYILKTVQ